MPHKISDMTWYVIEVANRKTSPIQRAICYHISGEMVEILTASGVKIPTTVHIRDLAYFRVIAPIPEMNEEKYPNKFRLPAEIEAASIKAE
jgi:hypothetical protein